MASSAGIVGSGGGFCVGSSASAFGRAAGKGARRCGTVRCAYTASSSGLREQYRTLKVPPGSSEVEVKKAFRQLALKYHPDVCRDCDCGAKFQRINEAYGAVMSSIRAGVEVEETRREQQQAKVDSRYYDEWEEYMGFEAAGFRDYYSRAEPYC